MRFNFGTHDRITVRSVGYRLHGTSDQGHVFERVDQPGVFEAFSDDRLVMETQRPDYRYDRDLYSPERGQAMLFSGVWGFEDIPPQEMGEIFWREKFCTRFIQGEAEGDFSRSDEGMDEAVQTIVREFADAAEPTNGKKKRAGAVREEPVRHPPSGRSLLRWVLRLEAAGFCATGLRKSYHRCGNHGARVDPEAEKLMRKHAVDYASETRPTKIGCHRNLKAAISAFNAVRAEAGLAPIAYPAKGTFYARIAALDAFEVCAARMGLAFAARKYGMLGTGLQVDRAGERVEIDEWSVQLQTLLSETGLLHVLDEETQKRVRTLRVWLSLALDTASRCILGMSISREQSTDSAISTLHLCLRDKGVYADHAGALTPWDMACTPESIVTDAGSTLINDRFKSRVAALRIRPHTAPAGRPQLRARGERIFGTLNTQVMSRFTGRSFENPVVKGDYASEDRASISVDALCVALVRYVVDIYHNTPHEGLRGETPRNAWLRLTTEKGIKPPPGKDVCRHVFGIEVQPVTGPHGVRVLNLNYTSLALQEYRRKVSDGPVRVRIDPEDIGRVSVHLHGAWYVLGCRLSGFDGVSIAQWMAAAADLRHRFAAEAQVSEHVVHEAVRAIGKISSQGIAKFGLLDVRPDAESIRRAERTLEIGFRMPDSDGVKQPHERRDPEIGLFDGFVEGTVEEVQPPSSPQALSYRITGLDDE